jgi:hypothetical protein
MTVPKLERENYIIRLATQKNRQYESSGMKEKTNLYFGGNINFQEV